MQLIQFLFSKLVIIYLKILGVKIDFKAQINNFPYLKIKGLPENIIIGKVKILGKIDLRNRENGKIIFEDNCIIEKDCRFVSARDGTIRIGKGSAITMGAVINGGGNVIVGSDCILGPRIMINANEHVFKKDKLIKDQGFIHRDVIIEEDCWFGANVVINKGSLVKKGSVVGALSLINGKTEENSINVGIPTKKIGEREK